MAGSQTKNKKLHPWGCLTASTAWMMGLDEASVLKALGHDGSEIVLEDQPGPTGRAGHHIQEIIHFILCQGGSLTPYEYLPRSETGVTERVVFEAGKTQPREYRFIYSLLTEKGLVTCSKFSDPTMHYMAFDEGYLFDPDTGETTFISKVVQSGGGVDHKKTFDKLAVHMLNLGLLPKQIWIYGDRK